MDSLDGDSDAGREAADFHRRILDGLPAAVYATDMSGVITYYNRAAARLWEREPVIGKDLWCGSWRIYSIDGRPIPLDRCPMAVALRDGREVKGIDILIERPDGTRRHIQPQLVPLRNSAGTLMGAINTLIDVTDCLSADKASRRLAAIVAHSDDAIISKNLDGIITSWNGAAERMFGYTEAEMIGRPIMTLIPPDLAEEERSILRRICAGKVIDHYETVRLRKDGTTIPVSLTVSPIKDGNGRVMGASKIARDISEQRARREIEQARDAAEAASRAKDSMFAALSHELRTPLHPVMLVASAALKNPHLPVEVRADFEIILDNVSLETRLIDDMLDLTKIEHGKLDLMRLPLVLDSLVGDAVATIRSDALAKKSPCR